MENKKYTVMASGKMRQCAYDALKDMEFKINSATPTITSFTADKTSGQPAGTTIKFTANSNLGSTGLYEFMVKSGSTWSVVQKFSTKNTLDWTPSAAGTYTVRVKIKDPNSTKSYDALKDLQFTIN